ncbi:RNA polymerase sigma factor RpoE [Acidisarcina polymorpha]|uniref:RNA polymerase sigma factor RpoE n=1 Tax=Acidisarcina polymorpha TaxID=2211140 RepID=A0A2Z5G435_9BACT|nr:sigma-70 family RNA polymerase sigma factor [Acidisarcina polymorpha]AXC13564.1 RNA polymerase sigma factor RpoE [Acidisarcina polymorpha]
MQAEIVVGNVAGIAVIRPEESAIIAELKAGSEEAFAWLIATYHQPLYSLVARTVPDPADAADLTQDIFIKIYRGIGSFRGNSSLRTWIYRIALHEALNQRRWWSRHKRQEVTIEAESGDTSDGQPISIKDTLIDGHQSPFDFAAAQQVRDRVEEQLRRLPEPFRTVVVLRDIEGFAYEEIADILGINLGTVKSRLMRGRAQLKTLLAPFAKATATPLGTGSGRMNSFDNLQTEEAL